jgi:hypothetical protein
MKNVLLTPEVLVVKLINDQRSVQEQIAMIVGIPEVLFCGLCRSKPAGTVRTQERKAGCCFKSSHGNY